VNGDGRAEVIVGSGPGMWAEVWVLDATTGATLRTLSPYGPYPGGLFVAAGDVTGDGFADIVTGAGEGGGPDVAVTDGVTGVQVMRFYAFDPSFAGGVRVAVGDVTGDRHAEVIVGSGPGMTATVRVFDGVTGAQMNEVQPYGGNVGGVFVATAVPVNRMALDLPTPGATVGLPFVVGGWAFVSDPADAGVSLIDVWAVPVGGGTPTYLGQATLGDTRPDVAAIFGNQYAHAGFSMIVPALPAGNYDIAVSALSRVTGTFQIMRVVRITVTP
jgi:FG-GAP-like repeat